MGKRKLTYWFIAVVVVVIAVFDVYVILDAGKESSVSQVLIELSYEYPSLTFMMGFVMGHLFWRMKSNKQMKKAVGEE
jgi:uncharacterized membrane-anchored protein YhcB (DUF1043 family)